MPENMTINENGDIEVITADGEKTIYTRNEDGTYTMPVRSEEGSNMTYIDENGEKQYVEEGKVKVNEEIVLKKIK